MKHDIQIQKDVVAELDREQNVDSGSIGVEVHHGVVKLAGRVTDPAAKTDAERAARNVEGVRTVVVDIDVGRPASAQRQARAR